MKQIHKNTHCVQKIFCIFTYQYIGTIYSRIPVLKTIINIFLHFSVVLLVTFWTNGQPVLRC
jgi:hypothetical protein